MSAVLELIFETVVIKGITYLVKKAVDAAGKAISQFFEDKDGDGNPDSDEPVFTLPRDETSTVAPGMSGDIVLITPDGPVVMFSDDTSHYDELCSRAAEQWAEQYGATVKPFTQFSVSEALLFIIAAISIFFFICKIFKRRKM